MKKYLNLPSIYTILVIVHVILGYYEIPTTVFRIVYVPRYLLEIWFVFKGLKYITSSTYMKALSVLVVVFLIYGSLLIMVGVDSSWKLSGDWGLLFINDYVISLIPIFVFFYFGVTSQIDENWFSKVCVLFIICAFIEYNSARVALVLNNVSESSESFVNNMGYSLISLIPVLLFLKRPIIQYTVIILIYVFVLFSYKRGAIITCSVAFLLFLFLRVKEQWKTNKVILLILSLGAIIIGAQYLQNMFTQDDVFQARYLKSFEGGSHRESLYPEIMNYLFNDNNAFTFMFGNGAYATCKYFASMAHNDWLEFAMDFGLVGLILYIRYWIALYETAKQSRRGESKEVSDAILLFAIIYLIPTVFSMSFSSINIYSGSVMGFCAGYLARANKYSKKMIVSNKTFRS